MIQLVLVSVGFLSFGFLAGWAFERLRAGSVRRLRLGAR